MSGKIVLGIVLVYTLLLLGLLAVTKEEYKKKYYGKVKLIASLGFVAAAFVCAAASGNWGLMLAMLPSLLLCTAGDVYLARYQTGDIKRDMLKGIATFLLAHIGFLAVMFYLSRDVHVYNVIAPLCAVAVLFLCVRLFHLKMGKLRTPSFIYALFVSAMAAKAVAVAGVTPAPFSWLMGAGGLLFFASDFSIIFLYFYHYKQKGHRRYVQMFNLVTYYYAVLAFDFCILFY